MLNNIRDYDAALEKYSKPLMQQIRYDKKGDGEIEVTNLQEVDGYFRYPDLTDQLTASNRTLILVKMTYKKSSRQSLLSSDLISITNRYRTSLFTTRW